jgi:hypothetical protein
VNRFLKSRWVDVVAAVAGGALAGFGIGRVLGGRMVPGGIAVMAGVLLLWWAFSDARRMDPRAPESEADGSHTVE